MAENENWDCPMKKQCYGCIPAVQLKLDSCTDLKVIEELKFCINFLKTHSQIKAGEWIEKNKLNEGDTNETY
jgi:hypothetical protein